MYSIIEEGKPLNLYQRFSKEEQVSKILNILSVVKENGICSSFVKACQELNVSYKVLDPFQKTGYCI